MMGERIIRIAVMLICAVFVIHGCKSPGDVTGSAQGLNIYSGPKVLVVADDIDVAMDTAYLVTGCLGYMAAPYTSIEAAVAGRQLADAFDILLLCAWATSGWEETDLISDYPYRDSFEAKGKGLVVVGDLESAVGLKVVYAVAQAADDQEFNRKFAEIPDGIYSGDFIGWCRGESQPYKELAFEPYDGNLPKPRYGSEKSIDEILAEHPDPFGARPLYIDLSNGWTTEQVARPYYSHQVTIPRDWSGATMLLHLPHSDEKLDISVGDDLIATTIEPSIGPVNIGVAKSGDAFDIRIHRSSSLINRDTSDPTEFVDSINFAPVRIEATIPNAPQYKIYWDEETEQLIAECNFLSNAKPYRESDIGALPGGTIYCTARHPDGEAVRLSAIIPAKSPRNRITFPLSKQISWHLTDPQLYRFHFLYETVDGVDEYIAAFGYNRVTSPLGYFKFENWSAFLRGAYDSKVYTPTDRDKAFFENLITDGFNLYLTDNPLSPRELYSAAEAGMLTACISNITRVGMLSKSAYGETIPPNYIQSPSWMGEAEIEEHLDASFAMSSLSFPNKLEFSAQETGRVWELIPFPKHTIMINTDGSDLSGLESALAFRDVFSENEGETVPECIAYYTTLDEDGSPSSFSLYEFVNMARSYEWCAGFIIPLDIFNPDEDIKLMTDDFLIIDIDGFPIDVPIKARRGSTLKVPIRIANLKAKGDRGGAIFWGWDGTGEEGRINYKDLPYKGIIKMPDLEIPVPKETGEYRLRLLLIDFDGIVQAFNHLYVVVG